MEESLLYEKNTHYRLQEQNLKECKIEAVTPKMDIIAGTQNSTITHKFTKMTVMTS